MKPLVLAIPLVVVLCATRADSQTFSTLVQFTGTGGTASGFEGFGSLTLSGTTLYGVTQAGGAYGDGNIFSVGTDGTNYQNLLSFTGTGGAAIGESPVGKLAVSGTTLYGMTSEFTVINSYGNVFSVGTDGTNYQTVVSFTGYGGTARGWGPYGSLTLSGTTLYGMTRTGGAYGVGNIFSVGADGTNYQSLLSFTGTGGSACGQYTYGGLALNGTILYGMTLDGGNLGYGNVFSVGTGGTNYQNLVSFTGAGGTASGWQPLADLTLSGTTLYGMTADLRTGYGHIFSVGTNGTNYEGLLSFTGIGGSASGWTPGGSLILSGTTLYGTTRYGGADGEGNIFSVGIDGSGYQDLYSFTGYNDGSEPLGNLTLSGGTLFGMTPYGGANGDGTVFALALPASTPEPGTLVLLAAGALSLLGSRMRLRRRHATLPPVSRNRDAPPTLSFPSRLPEAMRRAA